MKQVSFVFKVPVDRAAGDTCLPGDLLKRGVRNPLL